MDCKSLTSDLLVEYAMKKLSGGDHSEVKGHLLRCRKCSKNLDEIRSMTEDLRDAAAKVEVDIPKEVDKAALYPPTEKDRTKFHPKPKPERPTTTFRPVQKSEPKFRKEYWYAISAACVAFGLVFSMIITPSGVGKIREELEIEKSRTDNLEKNIGNSIGEIVKMMERYQDLDTDLAKAVRINTKQAEKIKVLDGSMSGVKETLKDVQSVNGEQSDRITALKKENKQQKTDIRKHKNGIARHKKDIKSIRRKMDGLKVELAAAKAENDRLAKKLLLVGDLSGDGIVDVADAMRIFRHVLEGEVEYNAKSDANRDGVVDIGDVLFIMNRSLAGE